MLLYFHRSPYIYTQLPYPDRMNGRNIMTMAFRLYCIHKCIKQYLLQNTIYKHKNIDDAAYFNKHTALKSI